MTCGLGSGSAWASQCRGLDSKAAFAWLPGLCSEVTAFSPIWGAHVEFQREHENAEMSTLPCTVHTLK